VTRRSEMAVLLTRIVSSETEGGPVPLNAIYSAVARERPDLVDDEIEASTGAIHWKHDLRWEIETAVVKGTLRRRKDLGKAIYST
jgi:hypothetical protein